MRFVMLRSVENSKKKNDKGERKKKLKIRFKDII